MADHRLQNWSVPYNGEMKVPLSARPSKSKTPNLPRFATGPLRPLTKWSPEESKHTKSISTHESSLHDRSVATMVGDQSDFAELSTEDVADAWANISQMPSCGISLGPEASSRFYGAMAGPQVEKELRRQATVLKCLQRDMGILKDSVWHLEEDKEHLRKDYQEAKDYVKTIKEIAENIEKQDVESLRLSLFETSIATTELSAHYTTIRDIIQNDIGHKLAGFGNRLVALEENAVIGTSDGVRELPDRVALVEAEITMMRYGEKRADDAWNSTMQRRIEDCESTIANLHGTSGDLKRLVQTLEDENLIGTVKEVTDQVNSMRSMIEQIMKPESLTEATPNGEWEECMNDMAEIQQMMPKVAQMMESAKEFGCRGLAGSSSKSAPLSKSSSTTEIVEPPSEYLESVVVSHAAGIVLEEMEIVTNAKDAVQEHKDEASNNDSR